MTFTLTATGRGRGTARAVRICDHLPAALDVVAAPGAQRQSDGRWCWSIARLQSGSSRSVHITARARSVSRARRVTNVATLTAAGQAPRIARAAVRIVPPSARLTG